MIVNYVSKSEFRDEFIKMNRENQFSYKGLNALYDYIEEYYQEADKPYELDVIELCCEYTEYDSLEDVMGCTTNLITKKNVIKFI